jgi:hypothetical protein
VRSAAVSRAFVQLLGDGKIDNHQNEGRFKDNSDKTQRLDLRSRRSQEPHVSAKSKNASFAKARAVALFLIISEVSR